MYFALFHVYFLSSPHGFCGLSLATTCCFLGHAMVFFWNRFEVPALLRGRINAGRPRFYVTGGGIGGDWGEYDAAPSPVRGGGADVGEGRASREASAERLSDEQVGMSLSGPNSRSGSRAPSPETSFLFQGSPRAGPVSNVVEAAHAAMLESEQEPPLLGSLVFNVLGAAADEAGGSRGPRRRRRTTE
ncbi:hypothetical protein TeGR_g1083 [Tetraparma gracilis]|uniref:Uncharacterized protein n=1 Tax=Tetraparma gracilis TaxID=2962635 RepID=A0ABQ6MVP0_9STRA|nr:hypothetical protein TeGR_g1083 [Tetraparma gracilis]